MLNQKLCAAVLLSNHKDKDFPIIPLRHRRRNRDLFFKHGYYILILCGLYFVYCQYICDKAADKWFYTYLWRLIIKTKIWTVSSNLTNGFFHYSTAPGVLTF